MISNYLLAAWRHIANNRLFSVINIFGLSVGLMSCILILIYVRDELSYDQWLPDGERLVRLHTAYYSPDAPPFLTIRAAGRMMEAIRNYASDQVETGLRLVEVGVTVVRGDAIFNEDIMFADGTFFDVFQLPFVHGSAGTSFSKPMDLVITESTAIKYFGRTDVVGKNLTACCLQGSQLEVQVTGVIRDLPENTHLEFEFLTFLDPSMFDFAPNVLNTWTSVNTYTYFKLKAGADAESLKKRVDYWLNNESPLREMVEEGVLPSERLQLKIMPVPDLHLKALRDAGNIGDMKPLGNNSMVLAFVGIAFLILLIASVNFMNLSTARASRRAREVALRKVMGASRRQVAMQFLGEAVAISVLSLLFALVAVELVLPFYNMAIGRQLNLVLSDDLPLLITLVSIAVLVGLVSGSYPAIYLSRFLPARILKANQSSDGGGQSNIRSLLVIFQFAASIGLAVCTVVIYAQTSYARSMDVGYNYENKIVLSGLGATAAVDQRQTIVNELTAIEGVEHVVLSSEVPSQDNENNTGFTLLEGASEGLSESVVLNYYTAGFGFFEAYEMEMLAGRGFDEAFSSDVIVPVPEGDDRIGHAGVVINESAMRRLGFSSPEEALGKTLRADMFRAGTFDLSIVGVAKDVYFRSIKFGIRASVFLNNPGSLRVATLGFRTHDVAGLVREVERVWKKILPTTPISREFLSEMIQAQYQAEEDQAKLFGIFSALAVVIACLGLYGLASFTAERRTREIGIRKVMGARVRDIVGLLVWQFSAPVLIANILAWPIAWYVMSEWLDGFSYRIEGHYILVASMAAGTAALLIAWLTVAGRAWKVAAANPVNSLRYE